MAETTNDSASDTGIGALLRASRMRIGEDLRDVAGMLRIRYPYLEAIEEGRFSDLPGQAYAVGFVTLERSKLMMAREFHNTIQPHFGEVELLTTDTGIFHD